MRDIKYENDAEIELDMKIKRKEDGRGKEGRKGTETKM